MSTIKDTFTGYILGSEFGLTEADPGQDRYAFGEFASMGASCRFSMVADRIPTAIRAKLDLEEDVHVRLTGTATAEEHRKGPRISIKVTRVEAVDAVASANGAADVKVTATSRS